MKQKFTSLLSAFLFFAFNSKAQTCLPTTAPNLVLKNPVYITGTGTGAGTVNAKYRFSNVTNSTPATTDVIVTLKAIVNAVLTNMDDDISNPGTANNFQPVVTANAGTYGYVQFDFGFFVTATTTPFTQTCINFTALDIDGQTGVKEKVTVSDVSQGAISNPSNLTFSKVGNESSIISNNTGCNGICTNPENVCNFGKVTSNNIVFTYGNENTTGAAVTRFGSFQFAPYLQPLVFSLPLQFNGLYLQTNYNLVTVSFKTLNEINLQSFQIERSFDGINFSTIKILLPKNGNTNNEYAFNDNITGLGNTVFYRVKATDFNGKESYTAIVKTQSLNGNNGLVVYPNPVQSQGFISYTAKESGSASIKIIAASGAILKTTTIQLIKGVNVFPVNQAEKLTAGTYMVILSKANTVLGTGKLIKQ